MSRRRVVVTGLGVASCFGSDIDTFYSRLLKGDSGVNTLTDLGSSEFTTKFGAPVQDFDPTGYVDKKQARRADKFLLYGLVAGKQAMERAGLLVDGEVNQQLDKERCGIIVGSGMGGMEMFREGVETFLSRGPRKLSPFFVPYIITNMAGGMLAIDLGFMGPNYSISTACATGNHCIISAANHIRLGDADVMLAGGTEASLCPIGLAGFCACKALSTRNDEPQRASRPWDRGRDGFVLGEGGGVLVLEEYEHAKKRGAPILAEYLGGGVSCDAYHMTNPREDGGGIISSLKLGLRNAEVDPSRVNYYNAHATSTPLGDMAEIDALKKVIPDPSKVVINGTKSMIGHLLGGAGGVEAVATVMAISTGKIHPTINLEDPEPGLAPLIVPTEAMDLNVDIAVSNSFGFGGHNSTIVMGPVQ